MDNTPKEVYTGNDGNDNLCHPFDTTQAFDTTQDFVDDQLTQNTDITFDSTANPYGPYNPNVLHVTGVPNFNSQENEAISGGRYEPKVQKDSGSNDRARFAHPEDTARRQRQVQAIRSYQQLVQQCVDSEGDLKIKDFLKLAGDWHKIPCISNEMYGLDGVPFACGGRMDVKVMRDRNGLEVPHLACDDCDGVQIDGITIQRRLVAGCSAVMNNTFCGCCQEAIQPDDIIVPGNTTLESKLVSIHAVCMVSGQEFKEGYVNIDTDVCPCASKSGSRYLYPGWCKICREKIVPGQYGMAPPAGSPSIGSWNHRKCELKSQMRSHRRQTERIMYQLKARAQTLRSPTSPAPNYNNNLKAKESIYAEKTRWSNDHTSYTSSKPAGSALSTTTVERKPNAQESTSSQSTMPAGSARSTTTVLRGPSAYLSVGQQATGTVQTTSAQGKAENAKFEEEEEEDDSQASVVASRRTKRNSTSQDAHNNKKKA